ncbi:AraC family transcriptional regulator [Longicatena caecimuris]|uniref:helix-turn-helix domain-containing protein n=1 Tax=Longicatena caecimuris TaxID=1796635 RepID=UPI001D032F4C|nr:AraC family transcriptional regulator [Longicatena caecimuris]MCB5395630.1 AraC family transcriptional regulator [Longicatena caecimuris]MCB5566539.1 AraC family transcriptional regulator [Longicatena caecimuris]
MICNNHYLNKLYNALVTNSPKTISMNIPSDIGQGKIVQTKIKHGIVLSDWQMCYQSDMNVQGPVSKEYMQIIFCLNDGISWGIMDERRSVTIQKNESCIYAGHGGTEYICYKKDSNFSFKSIKIPITYFSQLLADYFDGQEVTAYEKKLLNGISKVPVTPVMEQILSETSRFTQYRGGLGYLYLDGKLLELLSIYLSEVLELDILMGKNISMSRTERTAIMEAKQIIDGQLAFAPSCEELSRMVHLSMSKLTRGFSSFYGMPIHQYIIEQRLAQAAQLLLEGDWNVSEIAAIVGYGKPSNFAAAFKKKYGVAPKNYRGSYLNKTKK